MSSDNSPTLRATSIQQWIQQQHSLDGDSDWAPENSLNHSSEVGLTTALYHPSERQLSKLVNAIQHGTKQQDRVSERNHRLSRQLAGKFLLFGDVFEQGKLESCLNDDDEIFKCLLHFLLAIATILNSDLVTTSLSATEQDSTSQRQSVSQELNRSIERATAVLDESESLYDTSDCESDSASGSNICATDPRMLYHKCLQPLSHNIGLLMELLPTLEATYNQKHATLEKDSSKQPFVTTAAASPYVAHIRDKFQSAPLDLANRLGEANWQRHQSIRASVANSTQKVEDTLASTQDAKTVFQPASAFQDSALGSSIPAEIDKDESVASHSSFLSSIGSDGETRRRVPSIPIATWGQLFPCPFCHTLVDIVTRVAWKMHVYADLSAYICTWPECTQALKLYSTRRAWAQHELEHHLSQVEYQCLVCERIFQDELSFSVHLRQHQVLPTILQKDALNKARRLVPLTLEQFRCNLCGKRGYPNSRTYATHVGHHLEDIALVALPRTADDTYEEQDSSASGLRDAPAHPVVSPPKEDKAHRLADMDIMVDTAAGSYCVGAATLDAGSPANFVTSSNADFLVLNGVSTIQVSEGKEFAATDGSTIVSRHKVDLQFRIGESAYKTTFEVIPETHYFDFLLGEKFLLDNFDLLQNLLVRGYGPRKTKEVLDQIKATDGNPKSAHNSAETT